MTWLALVAIAFAAAEMAVLLLVFIMWMMAAAGRRFDDYQIENDDGSEDFR